MTKIKLCGLTRKEDILAANALKMDFVGFVFAKHSKRYISPDHAMNLKCMLRPKVKAVGVFVNEEMDVIVEMAARGLIDWIQLHGDEDEEYIEKLRSKLGVVSESLCDSGKACQGESILHTVKQQQFQNSKTLPPKIIKAFRIPQDAGSDLAKQIHVSRADYVLLDSMIAGSGTCFDWEFVRHIKRDYFLAGGLHPENIASAIAMLHPFGVDTSSGIESGGKKDAKKMQEFVTSVLAGRQETSENIRYGGNDDNR